MFRMVAWYSMWWNEWWKPPVLWTRNPVIGTHTQQCSTKTTWRPLEITVLRILHFLGSVNLNKLYVWLYTQKHFARTLVCIRMIFVSSSSYVSRYCIKHVNAHFLLSSHIFSVTCVHPFKFILRIFLFWFF